VELSALTTPWIAEETDACFIVRDANGQALAFEEEPRWRLTMGLAGKSPFHWQLSQRIVIRVHIRGA
jgi:hypothetical protein